MKNIRVLALIVLSFSTALFALSIPKNHVVSTSWLQKHINDKNIIIIDTRKEKLYKRGHIPRAVNLSKKVWFKGQLGSVPKLYDTPAQVEELFSKAGITKESTLVFYSSGIKNKDFADAASGVWTAWIYGLKKSVILNGGFAKWTAEKKKVDLKIPTVTPSDFEVESFDSTDVASLKDIIQAIYDDNIQITDARVAKFYRGEDKKEELKRHGRIPTAKLTPIIRQVKKVGNHFEFLSKEKSRKTLKNGGFGIDLKKPLIVYCNTGHKARGVWFVAKFIDGMKNVKVYDGSMVEYSRTLLPVETGEPMD